MASKKVGWTKIIHHPSIVLILGARGSGKTATMCSILDQFHEQGTDVAVVAPKRVCKKYPKWVKCVNPERLNIPNNCVAGVDDAHLYFYAREWRKDSNKAFDFLARQSRHKDITILYTTQQARVLDISLVSMCDVVIIKQPSLLQRQFTRKEMRKLFDGVCVESKKYAYVISGTFKGEVGPYDCPEWFHTGISKSYESEKFEVAADYAWVGDLVRRGSELIKRLPV